MTEIIKWYQALGFPKEWDEEVLGAAQRFDPDKPEDTPMYHLLEVLSRCDALAAAYEKKGIGTDVLLASLQDIVIWSKNCHLVTGKIGLTELGWINLFMNMEMFRLGRLQFQFTQHKYSLERLKIREGDPALNVHIPQGVPLTHEDCLESYRMAKKFFETYYPEFHYQYFICSSWLLDFQLKEFLKPESNILKFQSDYDVFVYRESSGALRYLFTLNPEKEKKSTLQTRILAHLEEGGKLFGGYGVIDKDRID